MPPVVSAVSGFCCGYRRLLHNDSHRSHTSTVRTGAKKRADTVMGIQNNYRRFTADGPWPVKLSLAVVCHKSTNNVIYLSLKYVFRRLHKNIERSALDYCGLHTSRQTYYHLQQANTD